MLRQHTPMAATLSSSSTCNYQALCPQPLFYLPTNFTTIDYTNYSRHVCNRKIKILQKVTPRSLVEDTFTIRKKKSNKIQQSIKIFIAPYLYEAQHVSGDTPPIIRNLKLHWQLLIFHTWRVVGRVVGGRCQAHCA